MRKQIQVNTGKGWQNLTSVFYGGEKDRDKEEKKAQAEAERQVTGWRHNYAPYRDAQFRILDQRG